MGGNFLLESFGSDRAGRIDDENDVGENVRAFGFFAHVAENADSLQNQLVEVVNFVNVFVGRFRRDFVKFLTIVAIVVFAVAALMADSKMSRMFRSKTKKIPDRVNFGFLSANQFRRFRDFSRTVPFSVRHHDHALLDIGAQTSLRSKNISVKIIESFANASVAV